MFAAFGAGDLDALVETVHPESRWTYVGANPRLSRAEFTGHAKVRKFFEGILTRLDMTAFNTDEFIVQGDTVVVFGSEFGRYGRRNSLFATFGPRSTSYGTTRSPACSSTTSRSSPAGASFRAAGQEPGHVVVARHALGVRLRCEMRKSTRRGGLGLDRPADHRAVSALPARRDRCRGQRCRGAQDRLADRGTAQERPGSAAPGRSRRLGRDHRSVRVRRRRHPRWWWVVESDRAVHRGAAGRHA